MYEVCASVNQTRRPNRLCPDLPLDRVLGTARFLFLFWCSSPTKCFFSPAVDSVVCFFFPPIASRSCNRVTPHWNRVWDLHVFHVIFFTPHCDFFPFEWKNLYILYQPLCNVTRWPYNKLNCINTCLHWISGLLVVCLFIYLLHSILQFTTKIIAFLPWDQVTPKYDELYYC